MDRQFLIDNMKYINIESVYFYNLQKKYTLNKLKDLIEYNKSYEINVKWTFEKYTYDELLQIIIMFLNQDVISVVYDYLRAEKKMNLYLYESMIISIDLFFSTNTSVYNYYYCDYHDSFLTHIKILKCADANKCIRAAKGIINSEDYGMGCFFCLSVLKSDRPSPFRASCDDNVDEIGMMCQIAEYLLPNKKIDKLNRQMDEVD